MSHPDRSVALPDGNVIPLLGFGVFQIPDRHECVAAVQSALEAGYRHIDTARVYANEAHVGEAIATSGIPRSEIFLTSKTPLQADPDRIRPCFDESLRNLRTDYLDLYLIHWPMSDDTLLRQWEILTELQSGGRCRSIGVCNFSVERFERVLVGRTGRLPAVNQIELHVFHQQPALAAYCRTKGIALEAYSPLCRGRQIDHPTIATLAAKYGKTNAQILLRFLVQQDIVTLVKSANPSRIVENISIFDFALEPSDMARLRALDRGLVIQDWFPEGYY